MAVFPENMNKLDVNDVPGSLGRLENYIRYMTERIEFSVRNVTRNVNDAGVSSVEILLLMQEMAGTVATLSTTVNGMTGSITALGNRLDTMQSQQTGMAGDITALRTNVSQLQTAQTEMINAVVDIRSTISALDERVKTLEGTELGADIDCGSF